MDATTLSTHENVIRSIFVLNLVLPACESKVQTILYTLAPKPLSVSLSPAKSSVIVVHEELLQPTRILDALRTAGFEVSNSSSKPEIFRQIVPSTQSWESNVREHVVSQ